MITEDYVSFEIAKLLKEKGFDYQGFDYIDFEGEVIRQDRPTHQMAMKWLRGTHEIFIEIKRDNQWYEGYEVTPITKHDKERGHKPEYYAIILNKIGISKTTDHLDSYEEAVEAALKYALENLI